ncbi:MAG TPA: DUF350 domain-containing protein [Polyangiaceae bacterium]|jgi:uncharacterized membrane protein YjfL (UPF0719 family)|nr:DUF350 domain-containing protein [Polyangiaceae bacterium]
MDTASLYRLGVCFALAVFLLVVLEMSLRFFSKSPSLRQNEKAHNPASSLVHAADVVATLLIASTVAGGLDSDSVGKDLLHASLQGVAAELLFVVCSRAQVRFFVAAKLGGEIERGNVAAGAAAAGHSLATGILATTAVGSETARDVGISLVFFVLGQVALLGLVALFRALTVYDDAEEILGENVAAGLSYAGIAVAISLLVARATEGDFTTWTQSLGAFAQVLAYAPLLYLVRQFVVGSVVLGNRPTLRGGPLDRGIAARSVGLASLEAATYLGAALIVVRLP